MKSHMIRILIGTLGGVACLSAQATEPTTVAHWTFGANGLNDITGNNTIELENHGVTFTNGAAFFDGGSYLVTKDAIELGAATKSFTIECWVKFDAMDYLGYIFAPEDASQKGAFVVYQNPVSTIPHLFGQLRVVAPSTWQQESDSIASAGISYPHHIAYVVDAAKSGVNQAKLYLDGVQIENSGLKSSGDFSGGFGSRKLYIGIHGNDGSPNNGFKGRIDDIRITYDKQFFLGRHISRNFCRRHFSRRKRFKRMPPLERSGGHCIFRKTKVCAQKQACTQKNLIHSLLNTNPIIS